MVGLSPTPTNPDDVPAFPRAALIKPTPPEVEEHAVAELHIVPVFQPVPPTVIVPTVGEFQIEETRERADVPP